MKARMLSLLAAVAMFGAVSAASAAEPITLADNQLDAVSAGDYYYVDLYLSTTTYGSADSNQAFTSAALSHAATIAVTF